MSEDKIYDQTTDIPEGLLTPKEVTTSAGTFEFFDGTPINGTAAKAYDYLDTMRGVDAFLKGMPAASHYSLINGPKSIGVDAVNKVLIVEELMDSKPLFLTANTSTLYVFPYLDMQETGPIVLDVPAGGLGAFNDAWFRYMMDIGGAGPDRGNGGKFLLVPPGYENHLSAAHYEEYFVVKSPSFRVWLFLRYPYDKGLEETVAYVEEGLKVYPLREKDNPKEMVFINGSGKSFNTIHHNDVTFYEELNEVIQAEPLGLINEEMRGLFASIGIEKGKAFAPDDRMKRILTDAVAIGNAISRSIVWYPRVAGSVDNMAGIQFYPGSSWVMAFLKKNVFFRGSDGHTMNSDARVTFHYPYTAVTPAMATPKVGTGSDYAITFLDAEKKPFDGEKTYKLNIPADPPVDNFWAVTIYDTQTRSLLQTNQPLPTVGSKNGIQENDNHSFDIYFAPEKPEGVSENNWLQTIPGKSWLIILRMYAPRQEWIDKTWRPGEVELIA